jgi:hypothetical protein
MHGMAAVTLFCVETTRGLLPHRTWPQESKPVQQNIHEHIADSDPNRKNPHVLSQTMATRQYPLFGAGA